ncbi:phosphocholine cytidylyltransferase family protein [Methanobrevibacter sp.]
MKAIILNSGMGTRLGDLTKDNPKSLVEISDGTTIFSNAVSILKEFEIDEFIITTGYLKEVLKKYALETFPDVNFTFVHNPVYNKTNYIKSIDYIYDFDDDIILLHGDLVFTRKTAERVVNSDKTSVVIDSTVPIPQDDFKAKIEGGFVRYIGVDYFNEGAVACQPFYILKSQDWIVWKKKIKEFCQNGNTNVYAENALNEVYDQIDLLPIDLKGELCMEVDNKDDLNKVKENL